MKELIVVRHSKAADYSSSRTDHDRPLSSKGIVKAEYIAEFLVGRTAAPDLFLSSTAARALTTAQIFSAAFEFPVADTQQEQGLYDFGGYARVLGILRALPAESNRVILFGHNPTFTALTWHLCSAFRHEMPTSACAGLELPIDHWEEIQADEARLLFYFTRPIIRKIRSEQGA